MTHQPAPHPDIATQARELLAVTQEDRDAAAAYWALPGGDDDAKMRAGEWDDSDVVQAFAAHRLSALSRPGHRAAGVDLRDHISEQVAHVKQRIKDGVEMGASIWRIALEEVVRENRAILASLAPSPEDAVESKETAFAISKRRNEEKVAERSLPTDQSVRASVVEEAVELETEPAPEDADEAMGWRSHKQGVGLAECRFKAGRLARWERGWKARREWRREGRNLAKGDA